MRIIQICLLLSILILFIYIAIMDESHIVTMFYGSVCMIVVIGLKLMQWNEDFIEYKNNQYELNERLKANSVNAHAGINDLYEQLNNRKE